MSVERVLPPNNEEVDVKPGGTTIGNQTVQGNATTTQINPQAIGTVGSLNLVHKDVNGTQIRTTITGVIIPFAASKLKILNVSGSSQWYKDGVALTAYASGTSRSWPLDLATPSITTANNQVSYTSAADPTSSDAVWTPMAYSNFVAAQLTTTRAS